MRQKIYNILNRIYGIMMSISFFGGFIPVIPFIIAIIVGGEFGENLSIFLYSKFYPVIIVIGSIAIIIGLVAMYVGKIESLSVKKISSDDNTK